MAIASYCKWSPESDVNVFSCVIGEHKVWMIHMDRNSPRGVRMCTSLAELVDTLKDLEGNNVKVPSELYKKIAAEADHKEKLLDDPNP